MRRVGKNGEERGESGGEWNCCSVQFIELKFILKQAHLLDIYISK